MVASTKCAVRTGRVTLPAKRTHARTHSRAGRILALRTSSTERFSEMNALISKMHNYLSIFAMRYPVVCPDLLLGAIL